MSDEVLFFQEFSVLGRDFTNAGSAEIDRIIHARLRPYLMEKYGSNRDNAPPNRP